jgi:cation diffusion facilitator CzcD-associated flavoprotein CzcO
MSSEQTYDVVIVGAGLSGIGAAYHLQTQCPDRSYTILEARPSIGGTWDLFRYPGIRSDSDMYTFGFSFKPWQNPQSIADGPSILEYINETADQFGIRPKIQFNHRVVAAAWSSGNQCWTLTVQTPDEVQQTITTRFLFMCSGYYDYEQGYQPTFPNQDTFQGTLVHPQHWDPALDYTDKRVVIIGSGATAVTLLPELAKRARMVTLLQRSPTYIANLPRQDKVANFLKKVLPGRWAYALVRWKNILFGLAFYQLSRRHPGWVKWLLKGHIRRQLGAQYEDRNFTPRYDPWDQRLCVVPDNDLFEAIKQGNARIVTDTIRSFTDSGVALDSGQEIKADIIVTATGLKVQLLGGMVLTVDEKTVDTAQVHAYKGVMFDDVPNFAVAIGYTNAPWTLKCDLNCYFVTKVLNHMRQHGHTVCTPRFDYQNLQSEPLLDFKAGYILRAQHILPKQGTKAPWKVYQNYLKDLRALKHSSVTDDYLEYA